MTHLTRIAISPQIQLQDSNKYTFLKRAPIEASNKPCELHTAATSRCCQLSSQSFGYRKVWLFLSPLMAVIQHTIVAPCPCAPFLKAHQWCSPAPQTAPLYLLWFPIFLGFSLDPPEQRVAMLNWSGLSQSSTSRVVSQR